MTPFGYIGKEIERRAQEGEEISLLEDLGPILYGRPQTGKTRSADPQLIAKARTMGLRKLMRESSVSQHAVERFLAGERIHPATRQKLADALDKLERDLIQ